MRQAASQERSPRPPAGPHPRRKFFVLADVTAKARGNRAAIALMAFEAVEAHRRYLRGRTWNQLRAATRLRLELERLAERALRGIALGRKA
jgi:hypothetical protein